MTRAIVALAQYRAENGNWPAKLDELVPRYLPQLPKDAYSTGGQDPVRYSKTDAGVLLYSVGPNQVDNGGRNQGDIAVGAAGK